MNSDYMVYMLKKFYATRLIPFSKEELRDECIKLNDEQEKLRHKIAFLQTRFISLSDEISKARAEAQKYKAMYAEVVERNVILSQALMTREGEHEQETARI